MHATLTFLVSAYMLSITDRSLLSRNDKIEELILAFSLGYFIYDTIFGILYNFNNWLMHFHHLITMNISGYSLITGNHSRLFLLVLFYGEATNPLYLF